MTKLDGDPPEKVAGQDSRRRSNRQQEQGSPKKKAPSAEQHSGERRWNPFRTKHLLDSVVGKSIPELPLPRALPSLSATHRRWQLVPGAHGPVLRALSGLHPVGEGRI